MSQSPAQKCQPVLFFGHGSPMNAVQQNAFTKRVEDLGRELLQNRPRAIVCVSAHWMTQGTFVTHASHPETIHDFGGFPKELFAVQYNAPGDPKLAEEISAKATAPVIKLDEDWGFDHGTWSVLKYLVPKADIPTLQLSLDLTQPATYHLELGRKLAWLRDENVLLIASGNITHNLRRIDRDPAGPPVAWAAEFDAWAKANLGRRDFDLLASDYHQTEAGRLSVPSVEHYLPLLYIAGASRADDHIRFEYEGMEYGSLAMTSFSFGR